MENVQRSQVRTLKATTNLFVQIKLLIALYFIINALFYIELKDSVLLKNSGSGNEKCVQKSSKATTNYFVQN